ncbi:MAG: hypothetical protein ACM3U1_08125 [Chloroflexota bacterium]
MNEVKRNLKELCDKSYAGNNAYKLYLYALPTNPKDSHIFSGKISSTTSSCGFAAKEGRGGDGVGY